MLNFSMDNDKEHKEKFVATLVVVILKVMMGFACLTEVSGQFYYRYIQAFKMMVRHKTVLALIETMNGDNYGPERLNISNSDNIVLYKANNKELPILIRAKSTIVKDPLC